MVDVGSEAKAKMIAGVIEDEQMVFAGESPEFAPDRLDKSHLRFCRPRIDETGDQWKVDAGRERGDVADDLGCAGAEAIEDALPIDPIGVAIDVVAATPASTKRCCKCSAWGRLTA